MELKEFVAGAIGEIIEGIKTAQSDVEKAGGIVNPGGAFLKNGDTDLGTVEIGGIRYPVHEFNFDIAVSAADTKNTQGGIGIMVAALALGSKGETQTQNATISRISFTVPIVFPPGKNAGFAPKSNNYIAAGNRQYK